MSSLIELLKLSIALLVVELNFVADDKLEDTSGFVSNDVVRNEVSVKSFIISEEDENSSEICFIVETVEVVKMADEVVVSLAAVVLAEVLVVVINVVDVVVVEIVVVEKTTVVEGVEVVIDVEVVEIVVFDNDVVIDFVAMDFVDDFILVSF